MPETLSLPQKLDFAYAPEFLGHLRALRGQNVILDGGNVKVLGGLCAQILLSARHHWNSDGKSLRVDTSPAMKEDMSRLGLHQEMLNVTVFQ